MTSPLVIKSLQRHETYYIPTADLSFVVENIQFRVHRYFFERESGFFRARLLPSASLDGHLPGSDDSNAIILEEVTPSQFARFLWVFYNPRYSLYDEATLDDWETILTLSHRWFFPEVKQLAIRELQKQEMADVKRIALYHDFGVDRTLLIPHYVALCEREQPLTLDEGLTLEMETTVMVACGREAVLSTRLADGSLNPQWLLAMVRDVFKVPPYPVEAVVTPINGDTTITPTHPKQDQAPPPPAKETVNGSNTGASAMATTPTTTTKTNKKTTQAMNNQGQQLDNANKTKEKSKRKKLASHKEDLESQPSVAEQQGTPAGFGKPVGDGTNAVRTNDETENNRQSQTTPATDKQPEKDSEVSDATKTKSEGGGGVPTTMTNLANGETKSETAGTGAEKLHIRTDSSAKVGSASSGLDLFDDLSSFS